MLGKAIVVPTVMVGPETRHRQAYAGIWLVGFMRDDPGYIDLEQRTLQTVDNPFGTTLSPMS